MNWSLLPTISAPMPFQLALDELLFESRKAEGSASFLRFYVSSTRWVSAGYSFRGFETLSKSALILQNPKVPVCRRVTGGGCVLHGHDLIFSLTVQINTDPERFGSVQTSYANIHAGVKIGLQTCGLDPEFYGAKDVLPKGKDCFDFPVKSDLSWKGKKIAGGAQKRAEGVLLHQESIFVPTGVERRNLICAVSQGLGEVFGVTIENADLDPEWYFQAERKGMSFEPIAGR